MIRKAKFILKEAKLRVKYLAEKECIFCKIIRGEIKTDFVVENEKIVAFDDVNPLAQVHVLIVPKKHIESVLAVGDRDGGNLVAMHQVVREIVDKKKLDAFRLAFNGGRFQHVPHLHMHLLAGGNIVWSKL